MVTLTPTPNTVVRDGLKAIVWLAGAAIIATAGLSAATTQEPGAVMEWVWRVFGPTFGLVYALLAGIGVWAVLRLRRGLHINYWREVGDQCAAAIATADGYGRFGCAMARRGVVNHFGLEGEVDIEIGSLSKAFSVMGGFIAAKQPL